MDKLAAMRIYAAVVDEGGFSAAARRLNLSKSAISACIKDLEAYLGVALLHRTTRKIHVTEAGRRYKERCDQILAQIEEADIEAASLTSSPRGVLRISAGVSFGMLEVASAIAPYMALYPDVKIDLNLADRYVDIIEEGFDLAIRIGHLPDSSLMARKLTSTRRVVCAAPAYLQRHGLPEEPEDLRHHNCLNYNLLMTGGAWSFQRNGAPFLVEVSGSLSVNNGDAIHQAAMDGLGVCFGPTFIVGDALRSGKLVPLLEDYELPPLGVHAIFPPNRHMSAKVRTFIDFLGQCYGDPPRWERDL